MGTYQRITINTVQRGETTVWRIVGWTGKDRVLTVAYCPNEEMALVIKKVLEESEQGGSS